jgi:hypothetical protein
MLENDEDVTEFDAETRAMHWAFEERQKGELAPIYFFNYLAKTDVTVNHIVFIAHVIFNRCQSFSLSIQRH